MSPSPAARGHGKAQPCRGHESMLANHPDKRSLYKWALPCFPKCLLRSKILLSISAPRPFSASVPLPCDRRPPQTATGRRRAAQTALWGPDAPKRPQDAGERPRRLSGGQMPPNGHRTPETAPDGHRTPESGPDGHRTPESGPDGHRTPESGPDGHRTPETAPILSKIPTSRPGPGWRVWTPLNPLFYLTHLGRAPACAYARALCARARDFGFLISHTGRD